MRFSWVTIVAVLSAYARLNCAVSHGDQPLARVAIQKASVDINEKAYVKASPSVLGLQGQNKEWVHVEFSYPHPSENDRIGVFSPANFSSSTCLPENDNVLPPVLCSAPIKYQYANFSNPEYSQTGKGSLKLLLINQRSDFSLALFTGGLLKLKLVSMSNIVAFANPEAPVYPRLAQGKSWDEMTVTWTSGYGIDEAVPLVEWGLQRGQRIRSPAGTLSFDRKSMCEGYVRYSTDYGMFRFCIAHTEQGWSEGTEQYRFIEHCLASVDRRKQLWLIFLAHRVLGYLSGDDYAEEGSFEEPMGRESLQKLWQKYKVDIALYGHVHNYEQTCPIYQNTCTNKEKTRYKGTLNRTIHVVVGVGGHSLDDFSMLPPMWSLVRDYDYGFVKLTAFDHFDHSNLSSTREVAMARFMTLSLSQEIILTS